MKKTIITIVSLIVLLTVLVYGYEFIFKKPIIDSPTVDQMEDQFTETLDIKEQYVDSTYTFVGSIMTPTPCHTLESSVNMITQDTYEIEVVTVPPAEGVMCAQVITEQNYKVSFEAGPNISVSALIDGVPYELNRYVIPEGANIDTFELFIKA